MTIRNIRLQERDLSLLTELAEVGLMDTTLIWQRHFPADRTGKACQRRLRLYLAHSLVQTVSLTVTFTEKSTGRLPTIFRITQAGVELLTYLTGEALKPIPRRDPRPEMLLHRLGIARFRLTVNDACKLQKLPAPAWIGEFDAVSGVRPGAKLAERFVLCETFPAADSGKHGCWADASFLLSIPSATVSGQPTHHPLLIYLEYDRSTETLAQVARKVPGYHALLTTRTFTKHWPYIKNPTVRIFFVVPSQERLENILSTIRDLPGAEFSRCTIASEMTSGTFFTAPLWRTTQGESRAILGRLSSM